MGNLNQDQAAPENTPIYYIYIFKVVFSSTADLDHFQEKSEPHKGDGALPKRSTMLVASYSVLADEKYL